MKQKFTPGEPCYCGRGKRAPHVTPNGKTIMKLHVVKECLNVHNSDISGSVYDDLKYVGINGGQRECCRLLVREC